ncbi:metallophosphoesterase [Larsenimonas suaedae]|uniref:Metallophosphoesterase n=1 Tax=Larsenimonas suaedae TaxID=1851019 RepID=A0ABU1GXQ0_9GAMM|nr:metallophosphoesterase [Larsenimonas suaedae]MCM2971513.1 metallophosphoesterase [Larsenimonas suaedae]MDR5896769.1 metallophosphoesterase [Larsenimonas suaedae]
MSEDAFDLIGDVHGCGATLAVLLERLGYTRCDGVYRHPSRRVIFLGDLIDRGPRVALALDIAKQMVDAGSALIVMGNHEYHALSYCSPSPSGSGWLRPHTPRSTNVIRETLEQFEGRDALWQSYLDWFMTLPLCLELPTLRVVHACWDEPLVRRFLETYPDGRIDRAFLNRTVESDSFEYRVLDRSTRGANVVLPDGLQIRSSDGFSRRAFRANFWTPEPETYGDVVFQPDHLPQELDARPLSERERRSLAYYAPTRRPLFIGHYWCEGIPALPAPNVACLDYSAVKYGRLVAYRFDGEQRLDANRFVWLKVLSERDAEKKSREFH